jgi:hypothetical protein
MSHFDPGGRGNLYVLIEAELSIDDIKSLYSAARSAESEAQAAAWKRPYPNAADFIIMLNIRIIEIFTTVQPFGSDDRERTIRSGKNLQGFGGSKNLDVCKDLFRRKHDYECSRLGPKTYEKAKLFIEEPFGFITKGTARR